MCPRDCSFALAVFAALALGGCVQTNPLASVPPDQYASMKAHADLSPAGLSTVEFKESGDTKRFAAAARLIHATWGGQCAPVLVLPRGYLATGNSRWMVKCASTQLPYDYEVQIPEKASGVAQVLQCFRTSPTSIACSIAGHPT